MKIIINYMILIFIAASGIGLSFYFYKKNQKKEKRILYGVSGSILYMTYIIFSFVLNKLKNYNLNAKNILNFMTITMIFVILTGKIILKNEKFINKKIDIIINFIFPIILFVLFTIKTLLKI